MCSHVRAAVDRVLAQRPGIGKAYLFPSGSDPSKPVSKDLANAWLVEAEKLAEVPRQKGSLWHSVNQATVELASRLGQMERV